MLDQYDFCSCHIKTLQLKVISQQSLSDGSLHATLYDGFSSTSTTGFLVLSNSNTSNSLFQIFPKYQKGSIVYYMDSY